MLNLKCVLIVCPDLKTMQFSHFFANVPTGEQYTGYEPGRSYCSLREGNFRVKMKRCEGCMHRWGFAPLFGKALSPNNQSQTWTMYYKIQINKHSESIPVFNFTPPTLREKVSKNINDTTIFTYGISAASAPIASSPFGVLDILAHFLATPHMHF